jgi:hypothetical protein
LKTKYLAVARPNVASSASVASNRRPTISPWLAREEKTPGVVHAGCAFMGYDSSRNPHLPIRQTTIR